MLKIRADLLVLFFLLFSLVDHAQNKLVLHRNMKNIELEKGHKVMPILVNDTAAFSGWTSSCTECSELPSDSIWEIDSITASAMTLKRVTSYRYDTISQGEFVRLQTSLQNELYRNTTDISMIANERFADSSVLIFKTPDRFTYRNIEFSELKALRFARNPICKKGDRRTQLMLAGIGAAGIIGIVVAQIVLIHPYPILILPVLGGIAMIKDSFTQLNYFKVKTYSLQDWKLSLKKDRKKNQ